MQCLNQSLRSQVCDEDDLGACRIMIANVGLVMGKLRADVWATDLEPNLPLLKDNFAANGESRMRH